MKDIKDYYMNFYTLAQSDYFKACKSLQDKYGPVPKPYFKMDSNGDFYRSKIGNIQKDQSISRFKQEGLFIHHVKEIEPIAKDISKPEIAKILPFEYQMPENLCYCNVLEHLILHIAIEKIYDPDTPSFGSVVIYFFNIYKVKDKQGLANSLKLDHEEWNELINFFCKDFISRRLSEYQTFMKQTLL